jgi:hypothetical protein
MVDGRLALAMSLLVAALACSGDDRSPTGPSAPQGLQLAVVVARQTIGVGESEQLAAIVTEPGRSSPIPAGSITWRSSDDRIVAVWAGGLAVALAPGQATITATAGERSASIVLRADGGSGLRRVHGRLSDYASDAGVGGTAVAFSIDPGARVFEFETMTDANGGFTIDLPPGRIGARIAGQSAGELTVRVGGPAFRGDLIANAGQYCKGRFGLVTDATTFQPVAGVSVRLGGREAVTGPDGWYRIDLGCVYDPFNNSNTTSISATHPAYREFSRVVGRGIVWVTRLDMELQR